MSEAESASQPGAARPRLCDQLTVIVTTSVVRTNPDTEFMTEVMQSFLYVPGLINCRKIIVCDGFQTTENAKGGWKRGRVTEANVPAYVEYRRRLRHYAAVAAALFDADDAGAEDRSTATATTATAEGGGESKAASPPELPPFEVDPAFGPPAPLTRGELAAYRRTEVLCPAERLGFGHAVKAAMERVRTEFVMVVQHDRRFCRPVDVASLVSDMRTHHQEYLRFFHDRTQHWQPPGQASEGKDAAALPPADRFPQWLPSPYRRPLSPQSSSLYLTPFPTLARPFPIHYVALSTVSTTGYHARMSHFVPGSRVEAAALPCPEMMAALRQSLGAGAGAGLPPFSPRLVPMLYWYDTTHVARADYYRDVIFGGLGDRLPVVFVRKGEFPEDSLGQYTIAIARAGSAALRRLLVAARRAGKDEEEHGDEAGRRRRRRIGGVVADASDDDDDDGSAEPRVETSPPAPAALSATHLRSLRALLTGAAFRRDKPASEDVVGLVQALSSLEAPHDAGDLTAAAREEARISAAAAHVPAPADTRRIHSLTMNTPPRSLQIVGQAAAAVAGVAHPDQALAVILCEFGMWLLEDYEGAAYTGKGGGWARPEWVPEPRWCLNATPRPAGGAEKQAAQGGRGEGSDSGSGSDDGEGSGSSRDGSSSDSSSSDSCSSSEAEEGGEGGDAEVQQGRLGRDQSSKASKAGATGVPDEPGRASTGPLDWLPFGCVQSPVPRPAVLHMDGRAYLTAQELASKGYAPPRRYALPSFIEADLTV